MNESLGIIIPGEQWKSEHATTANNQTPNIVIIAF